MLSRPNTTSSSGNTGSFMSLDRGWLLCYTLLVEDENTRDLLSLTYIFAALAFVKETDRHWLKRRFGMFEDALKDSWAYQEILQEGKLEERQEGLQRQRQALEYLIRK